MGQANAVGPASVEDRSLVSVWKCFTEYTVLITQLICLVNLLLSAAVWYLGKVSWRSYTESRLCTYCSFVQGDHSFSTMIFHDFSMTRKWISMTYRHNIFFEITIHDLWMLTKIKSFTETNILTHFYKKNSWISSLFSMTFHDLGCFPWLSRKIVHPDTS